jgi:hypothetical protein
MAPGVTEVWRPPPRCSNASTTRLAAKNTQPGRRTPRQGLHLRNVPGAGANLPTAGVNSLASPPMPAWFNSIEPENSSLSASAGRLNSPDSRKPARALTARRPRRGDPPAKETSRVTAGQVAGRFQPKLKIGPVLRQQVVRTAEVIYQRGRIFPARSPLSG